MDELFKINKGLEKAIAKLQAQVATQEKKLNLCFQMISEFGHFVPSVLEDFKSEIQKLDGDSIVTGNSFKAKIEGQDDLSESDIIPSSLKDDISPSEN